MKKGLGFTVACLALAALLVGATACQSQAAASSKTVAITVATTEFKFNPDTITVRVGDHVRVTLDNSQGTLEHNIKQPDLNIDTDVAAGKTATFEFTPTKAGTFDFICDEAGHTEAGMVGKIIVQP